MTTKRTLTAESLVSPEQETIKAKCFHPTGTFVKFTKQEIEQSILDRFEQQVAKFPDRVAVKSRKFTLTYNALNKTANRIARAILTRRSSQEEPVALLLDHDALAIASIIGTLKSGKFYVPMDPSHPHARMKSILEDLRASLILTDSKNLTLARQLTAGTRQFVNIETLDGSFADGNLGIPLMPDRLAYVLYTSGSTGQPKGVMQNHRNVLHDCMSYTNNLHICEADRVGLLASCSVGASVHYLYGALLNGATLCPFDVKEEGLSRLAAWLTQQQITFFQLSANVFRYFLDTLTGGEEFSDLRLIALGSAQITRKDVELFKKHFSPDCILLNRLSTTESNTIRWNFVDKHTKIEDEILAVGYAVEDKEILLLDGTGAEVGPNEIGEIAVKSRYLSPGYWEKPEVTQGAFFPVTEPNGERIYRTGDLGRMRPDGCLMHLGRKDFRVKIRGFTVEPAEIEKTLLEHDAIRETVVVPSKDKRGDVQLVAYVVANQESTSIGAGLRDFLKEKLPDYMIPSAFVVLDALPLNGNGKVDRQALPSPDSANAYLRDCLAGPTTPVETDLARIWTKVLHLESVGVHDNFFELGGHSLVATELICSIRDSFQIDLTLRHLFENPTIRDLGRHLMHHLETHSSGRHSIKRGSKSGQSALSIGQEGLWFLNQLEPEAPMYNEAVGLRLNGVLNVEAIQKALDAITVRHEVLRTNFFTVDGKPFQVTGKGRSVQLSVLDLTHWPIADREPEFQRLAKETIERPFDLCKDLMLRAALLRLGENDHALILVVHHIATDGHSEDILIREFATLYEAFSTGSVPSLPGLRLRYTDFVLWQRNLLQEEVLQQRLAYWKKRLAGIRPLELPTDRPRPALQSFRGSSESQVLGETLTANLRNVSRQEGVTLFMTLLAAFQVLLFRLTGDDDIAVGSPIAGRSRSEFEGLIGLFINTLVLRTDLSGNPTFRELLGRVREVALGAYDYQEVPFEQLIPELQLKRSSSRNTLFQVMFAFRQDPMEQNPIVSGISIRRFPIQTGTAKFDLNAAVYEGAERLRCYFTYNTDLFDSSTIKRLLGQFRVLLESIVFDPGTRISALPLLTNSEHEQILVKWNQTRRKYRKIEFVHELFEAQVERQRDRLAAIFEERQLTYGELNRRSNQLAHYLQKMGAGPEVRVGLLIERSLEMLIAMLAVLKAGGAYVPLDPNNPSERLTFLMRDAQVAILLTKRWLAESLPRDGGKVLCLDSDWEVICKEKETKPLGELSMDNVAYVIYTSGSTGTPKGVEVTHRSLFNFVRHTCDTLALQTEDRVLQFASPSFDTAAEEIFPCLAAGARLVLRTNGMLDSASVFFEKCRDWGITVLDLPTAYWHELTASLISERTAIPQQLRLLIIGGEKAIPECLTQWRRVVGGSVRLVNTYGPTEATVVATMMELVEPDQVSASVGVIPIGKPITNVQAYILDENLLPVPVRVSGELHVGGAGLARGYLNRSDLTAEKFVPNPFSDEAGARLYKTGDLARYLSDGNIEFLGRLDHQVKIRGFRIELGEVEVVLSQYPGVRQAVVMAREDVPGNKRLVAYVVWNRNQTVTASELKKFLKSTLPDYMVPSSFVMLDELPVTPNGKVNRKALPAPDRNRPELQEIFASPRSPAEKALADIWAAVLNLEQVGIHDNFFDLGGHSLLATQVISHTREAFHVDIPLRTLFENPTVADLAVKIAEIQTQKVAPSEIQDVLTDLESLSEEEAERLFLGAREGSKKA